MQRYSALARLMRNELEKVIRYQLKPVGGTALIVRLGKYCY